MHKLSPGCKILFLTGEFDSDMAGAALGAGGRGYVVKLDAGRELLTAVEAVLLGRRYFGRSLAGYGLTERENE